MTIHVHRGDLPDGISFGTSVAVDSETLGLNPLRDRLCVVQLSAGDGDAHLVQIPKENIDAPNLSALMADASVTKIFHFARFDIAAIKQYLNVDTTPVYCTKIVSKLTRTYTDRHGLKDLCRELLGVDLSKQQQSSDWAAEELSKEQKAYAASDVLHLHALKDILDQRLVRENRVHLAEAAFNFLPTRAELDLSGWDEQDIFHH
ncbi:MAG: ribonuclease D [Alphaproteobacteria bacterium]|jgi:ribonuclease D|nr:ribonuclease D [Alphaproteobacteria bacterium]MBT4085076.1 ribonuclease D [Alphaproteobacteria bacterium]MBT4546091.1 ribonuclease D [Alphaproteobacteria bacterium]MBT7744361.1 ribonuclease D [Alphaproteobacteria bacterium]